MSAQDSNSHDRPDPTCGPIIAEPQPREKLTAGWCQAKEAATWPEGIAVLIARFRSNGSIYDYQTTTYWRPDWTDKYKSSTNDIPPSKFLRIDSITDLASQLAERDEEIERLRARVLSAAGDDLCRLTQDEIKQLTSGAVQIPPKEEFLASCERFHAQIAGEVGVLNGCLTLAQMIAENERLRTQLTSAQRQIEKLTDERDEANAELHDVICEKKQAQAANAELRKRLEEAESELATLRQQVVRGPAVLGPGCWITAHWLDASNEWRPGYVVLPEHKVRNISRTMLAIRLPGRTDS